MDRNERVAANTPVKDKVPRGSRSKNHRESNKTRENFDPNVLLSSPSAKSFSNSSPVAGKSAKSQKSVTKNSKTNTVSVYSPQNKIKQRRFVVAKKNIKKEGDSKFGCKCEEKGAAGCGGYGKKCLTVAYENLRASQEEFFKNKNDNKGNGDIGQEKVAERVVQEEEMERSLMLHDLQTHIGLDEGKAEESVGLRGEVKECSDPSETESPDQIGNSTIKRRRDKLLEEARQSVPENGSGKVMHLVKAFEKLLYIPRSKESEDKDEEDDNNNHKEMKWVLPGLQHPKAPETTQDSPSSIPFCPQELFLTSENLGLDSRLSVSTSWEGSRGSISSRTSTGSRRSRRNSAESSGTFGGRKWKHQHQHQLKVTSQKPFKLRTEQRGRMKEEEFMKKVEEMMQEEERKRIPIAQGLPWTTDEPECLVKPPVKESTRPMDVKLHSDIRAVDRTEFDQQVSDKMTLIELHKMERAKQLKLAEEEEMRRLRKELVPKAQPMPYFDRPFIPRRSMKHPTVPKEPQFHIPQHKKIKCCLSWNDLSYLTCQL